LSAISLPSARDRAALADLRTGLEEYLRESLDDPDETGDRPINNLAAIGAALHLGLPVLEWQQAERNSGERERVLRSARLFSERARALIAQFQAGALTQPELAAAVQAEYRAAARRAFIAGRRSIGHLGPMTDDDESDIDDEGAADQALLNQFREPAAAGGLGGLLLSMVLDPTNLIDPDLARWAKERFGAGAERSVLGRLEGLADRLPSFAARGEMAGLARAGVGGDAVIVWWTLGHADHCVDCVRLSDGSPYRLEALESAGLHPGSGHTRCGGRCRCHLEYDLPSVVCADPMTGDLGDTGVVYEANTGRMDVRVMEAVACALPASVSSFEGPGFEMIDDDDAFAWDEELVANDLDWAGGTLVLPFDEAIREDARVAARLGWLTGTGSDGRRLWMDGADNELFVRRFETADGMSQYAFVFRDSGDGTSAIRFEGGVTIGGPTGSDAEMTMRAIRELASDARAAGRAFEVNWGTAGTGMRRWLDELGVPRGKVDVALRTFDDIPDSVLPSAGTIGGSTGARLVGDGAGRRFVDKAGASTSVGHVTEESIADRVYEAAGVPVADHRLLALSGDTVKRSRFVEGEDLATYLGHASAEEREAVLERLRDGFAADALLANRDAIGAAGDNIIVRGGVPIRIDNGGSLRYRARGSLKSDFGRDVYELRSLRDPARSPYTRMVYGPISDDRLRRQVLELEARRAEILAAIPDADLRRTVEERLDDMLAKTASVTPAPAAVVVDRSPYVIAGSDLDALVTRLETRVVPEAAPAGTIASEFGFDPVAYRDALAGSVSGATSVRVYMTSGDSVFLSRHGTRIEPLVSTLSTHEILPAHLAVLRHLAEEGDAVEVARAVADLPGMRDVLVRFGAVDAADHVTLSGADLRALADALDGIPAAAPTVPPVPTAAVPAVMSPPPAAYASPVDLARDYADGIIDRDEAVAWLTGAGFIKALDDPDGTLADLVAAVRPGVTPTPPVGAPVRPTLPATSPLGSAVPGAAPDVVVGIYAMDGDLLRSIIGPDATHVWEDTTALDKGVEYTKSLAAVPGGKGITYWWRVNPDKREIRWHWVTGVGPAGEGNALAGGAAAIDRFVSIMEASPNIDSIKFAMPGLMPRAWSDFLADIGAVSEKGGYRLSRDNAIVFRDRIRADITPAPVIVTPTVDPIVTRYGIDPNGIEVTGETSVTLVGAPYTRMSIDRVTRDASGLSTVAGSARVDWDILKSGEIRWYDIAGSKDDIDRMHAGVAAIRRFADELDRNPALTGVRFTGMQKMPETWRDLLIEAGGTPDGKLVRMSRDDVFALRDRLRGTSGVTLPSPPTIAAAVPAPAAAAPLPPKPAPPPKPPKPPKPPPPVLGIDHASLFDAMERLEIPDPDAFRRVMDGTTSGTYDYATLQLPPVTAGTPVSVRVYYTDSHYAFRGEGVTTVSFGHLAWGDKPQNARMFVAALKRISEEAPGRRIIVSKDVLTRTGLTARFKKYADAFGGGYTFAMTPEGMKRLVAEADEVIAFMSDPGVLAARAAAAAAEKARLVAEAEAKRLARIAPKPWVPPPDIPVMVPGESPSFFLDDADRITTTYGAKWTDYTAARTVRSADAYTVTLPDGTVHRYRRKTTPSGGTIVVELSLGPTPSVGRLAALRDAAAEARDAGKKLYISEAGLKDRLIIDRLGVGTERTYGRLTTEFGRGYEIESASGLDRMIAAIDADAFEPGTAPVARTSAIPTVWPDASRLTPKVTPRGAKIIFTDPAGAEWLFTPGEDAAEVAVYHLSRAFEGPMPPKRIYTLTVGGVPTEGSLMKMIPSGTSISADHLVAGLTDRELRDLIDHHVLDYAVGRSSVTTDFLRGEDRLWGTRKAGAFEQIAGEVAPPKTIAGALWRSMTTDPAMLDRITPSDVARSLRRLQAVSDDEFKRIMGPVVRGAGTTYPGYATPDAMMDALLDRKHAARTDFEKYITERVREASAARPLPPVWQEWLDEGASFNFDPADAGDAFATHFFDDDAVEAMTGDWSKSTRGGAYNKGNDSALEASWKTFAASRGVSAEEAQQRAIDHVRQELAKHQLATNRSTTSAKKIIAEGRFKSQFETGKSGGSFDLSGRANREALMFAYPVNLTKTKRPIYGYLTTRNPSGPGPAPTAGTTFYGEVTFGIKDEMRPRTTWVAADSLGSNEHPTPVNDPHWKAMSPTSRWGRSIDPWTVDLTTVDPYTELQYHAAPGSDFAMTLDDVEWVAFRSASDVDSVTAGHLTRAGFAPLPGNARVWYRP
jgi:hypothetical protein